MQTERVNGKRQHFDLIDSKFDRERYVREKAKLVIKAHIKAIKRIRAMEIEHSVMLSFLAHIAQYLKDGKALTADDRTCLHQGHKYAGTKALPTALELIERNIREIESEFYPGSKRIRGRSQ